MKIVPRLKASSETQKSNSQRAVIEEELDNGRPFPWEMRCQNLFQLNRTKLLRRPSLVAISYTHSRFTLVGFQAVLFSFWWPKDIPFEEKSKFLLSMISEAFYFDLPLEANFALNACCS